MSQTKVYHNKYKDVFTGNRSMSVPVANPQEEEMVSDPTENKRTLRRSKSGRVKAISRNRSMVSTYDFSNRTQEEEPPEEQRHFGRTEGINPDMMKRIERTWPRMEEGDRERGTQNRVVDK